MDLLLSNNWSLDKLISNFKMLKNSLSPVVKVLNNSLFNLIEIFCKKIHPSFN